MNPPDPTTRGYSWAVRVGTEMVVATAVGIGIGLYLDRWLGSRPWCTLIFFLFGVAAGFLNLYRAVNATMDKDHEGGA